MENFILGSGIAKEKVYRIPLAVDIELFNKYSMANRIDLRNKLGIPENAFVIGSFQKDGVGWDDGGEPKLIKGPDVFLEVIKKVATERKNIWVFLTGPARGYVKNGLKRMNIPFVHNYVDDYRKIGELYNLLDLYLITSREEGGPMALLESMASGVPIVTTRVGQAIDIVKHKVNGLVCDIEDVDSLYENVVLVINDKNMRELLIANGRKSAEEYSIKNQDLLWNEYFKGLL